MLLLAEEIVDDAHAALGPLYEAPAAPRPGGPAAGLKTEASRSPQASRSSRSGATPDRGPSRPAAARRR